jgi:hypothetical protein
MKIYAKLEGAAEAVNNLAALVRDLDSATPVALYQEAQDIMRESKRQVPVDTGRLRATGYVTPPQKDEQGRDYVELGYGTDYALYVHEIPPPEEGAPHPRQIQPGTRTARHVTGKWKYLEDPIKERADRIPENIRRRAQHVLEKYAKR